MIELIWGNSPDKYKNMTDNSSPNNNIADDEAAWIWKNGLVVRTKVLTNVLIKKVEKFNYKMESLGKRTGYLKDMEDLNLEIAEHLESLTDNVDIRDLFDFLTMCFCEYDHFYKENKEEILKDPEETQLLPLAHEIMFYDIQNLLDFITNNTVSS